MLVIAAGLGVVGTSRWAALIRTHTSELEAGRVGTQGRLLPPRFDAHELEGLPAPVQRESVGKDGVMVMLPWECGVSDYQPHDGMLIPQTGEAAWMRPGGRKAYFVGRVKKLSYEFLP